MEITEGRIESGIRIKLVMRMMVRRMVPDDGDHKDQRQEEKENPFLKNKFIK